MAYLLSPIVMAILIALPRMQRWASSIAFVVLSLSLALSSFSTSVTHLILSQGIAYGTAGCFAYAPSILFMPDWFVKKKSLAFGIVWVNYTLNLPPPFIQKNPILTPKQSNRAAQA